MKIKNSLADSKYLDCAYEKYIKDPTEKNLTELILASTAFIKHFSVCFYGGKYNADTLQAGYEGV